MDMNEGGWDDASSYPERSGGNNWSRDDGGSRGGRGGGRGGRGGRGGGRSDYQRPNDGGRTWTNSRAKQFQNADEKTEKLNLPEKFIGRFIGRGGSHINGLKDKYQVRINVESGEGESSLSLIGPTDLLNFAKTDISQMIDDWSKQDEGGNNWQDRRGGGNRQDDRGNWQHRGNNRQNDWQDRRGGQNRQDDGGNDWHNRGNNRQDGANQW